MKKSQRSIMFWRRIGCCDMSILTILHSFYDCLNEMVRPPLPPRPLPPPRTPRPTDIQFSTETPFKIAPPANLNPALVLSHPLTLTVSSAYLTSRLQPAAMPPMRPHIQLRIHMDSTVRWPVSARKSP